MEYIEIDWSEEEWRQHPIYHYSFSSYGRHRNDRRNRIGRVNHYPHRLYLCEGNKREFIHRLVYETWFGPIPDGLLIQHHDEHLPLPFLNGPGNLSLGTDQTNSSDRRYKDRGNRPVGQQNPTTNLTDEIVLEIRRLWGTRRTDIGPNHSLQPVSYKTLIQEFGVSNDQLTRIIQRKSWTHI